MFRCCSLETSHPLLLPQSLKDCSINLCLFFYGHISNYSLETSHPCPLPLSPKVCSLCLCLLCCPNVFRLLCFSSESKRPLLYENVVIRSPENVQVRDYLNRTMKAHRKWGCSDHDQGPGDALGSKLDLEWENLSDHVSRGLLLFSH